MPTHGSSPIKSRPFVSGKNIGLILSCNEYDQCFALITAAKKNKRNGTNFNIIGGY
jgi:hypothetical protein